MKDINLQLPNKGLVFVVGKSGSGKSTLLNLIGGLDSATSGSIEVDGNNLARFKEKDFCNYRNTHIGFIFQDFHLIDELTVYDNILLSLNLRHMDSREKVLAALAKVDLSGYEDRYPTELSGGEQQRVAIARAIVKNPHLILADEPTGNLDTNTAKSIVEILKKLSNECLILIVSHSIMDAHSYADRIIELKEGKIVSDLSRNPEFVDEMELENGELFYPEGKTLSDQDIQLINENKTKIVKKSDKFLPTQSEALQASTRIKIENKNLSFAKKMRLSGKFLKNRAFSISASSVMIAVIMVVMSMAQTIINFDADRILQGEMEKNNQQSIWMNKTASAEIQKLLARNYRIPVGENDVQMLKDAGYKGDVYPVLSHAVVVTSYGASLYGLGDSYFSNSPYMTSSFGTMIVGEDFLTKKFGNYKYAAQVDDFMPHGVIITDYIADSILALNERYAGKTYEDILGAYYPQSTSYARSYINGIIETGYRERHSKLIERIKETKKFSLNDFYDDDEFVALLNEIYDCLGYSFTTNPNFVSLFYDTDLPALLPYYKLNFNGIDYLSPNSNSFVTESVYINTDHITPSKNSIKNNWYYTATPPQIPEGAKYMRVAYHNGFDKEGDSFKKESATLVFSDGTMVPESVLNQYSNVYLDTADGTTFSTGGTYNYIKLSDFVEIPEGTTITEFFAISKMHTGYCAFYDENHRFISSKPTVRNEALPESTVLMGISTYNEIFRTEYTENTADTFVPHKVTLSHYRFDDVGNENPLFTKEVTIIGLSSASEARTMAVSYDIRELIEKDSIFTHSLYLDGVEGIEAVVNLSGKLNYEHQSITVEGIHTMTKAVFVFTSVFEIVAIFLCAAAILILMTFSTKIIKSKLHEIGILKALGAKNSSVGAVFGLQIMLIALLTCALSTVGYYFLIDFANDVLFEAMQELVPSQIVLDLEFFAFMPKVAVVNCLLVFVLALVSLIVPMIRIKAVKPVKIIKAKEE